MAAPVFSRSRLLIAGGLAVAIGVVGVSVASDETYEIDVVVPAADGLVKGSEVRIGGQDVGQVAALGVEGDQARLTLEIDGNRGPLHAGSDVHVRWNSVVGRRYVDVEPGPGTNPVFPEGKVLQGTTERVELDDVAAALDEPTRAKAKKLVAQLDRTLKRSDKDLNKTLEEAGPFVEALVAVLDGVGKDGQAIRTLVTNLHQVTDELARRDNDIATTVTDLRSLVAVAVQRADELAAALDELPSTLRTTNDLLVKLPPAVDETRPLLEDLQPAVHELPSVARQLDPFLQDLRPVVAELRPTLVGVDKLLEQTPGLLDIATETVPDAETALDQLQPAVSFLRPYTPEVVGFLTNWSSLFSAKNGSGHFGRAMLPASVSSFTSNPGVLPPSMFQAKEPAPGSLVDQPWTDANGDKVR